MEKTSQLCETSKQYETDDRANCNSMLRMCSESYKRNEYSKKKCKKRNECKGMAGRAGTTSLSFPQAGKFDSLR